MFKTCHIKTLFFVFILLVSGYKNAQADGCSGSWFNVEYSPWCDCWQVCGNFISDCSTNGLTVSWNFGDGTTYPNYNGFPCHSYAQPGTYTITMTVRGYCHSFPLFPSKTTCHINRTISVPAIVDPLIADFTVDTVCLGTGTFFTNQSTGPVGSNSYTWIFGDGTTSTVANPIHVFDSCGAYDVTLIISNQTPCCPIVGRDTMVKRVFVDCPPFSSSNQLGTTEPYIQESSGSVTTVGGQCAGSLTELSLTTTGPINWWEFQFPDGSTSNLSNPTFVYTACPPSVDFTRIVLETDRGCREIIDSLTGIFCPQNMALSSTMTLCAGECSGTATVIVSGGGTPPYSFIWNDPAQQTTATATNLCPGIFNVVVTDGNGCSATPPQGVEVLDFPFPFVGTVNVYGNILCRGWNGGSAVLTMTGGTPPYSYLWSTGATSNDEIDLPGGTHSVTATDAQGCVFTSPVNIPEPPQVTGTVTTTNASCGLCNGSATVNPTGGNGTFVYRWLHNPAITTQTATGLCTGVYQVVVEDATVFGCNDTIQFAISEIGAQPVTVAVLQNATCPTSCDGQAQATLTGGCANPPCIFEWIDSTGVFIGQTAATAVNLCQGEYIVRVTNGLGCRSFANVNITVPNPIVPVATPSPNTCTPCNGSITASATGGTGPYTYQWLDSGNNIIPGQSASTITGLCAGVYTVRITDQLSCTVSTTANVINNLLTGNATASSILCHGDCNGIITVNASWGTPPYTFTVLDNSGATVSTGSSQVIANLCAGTYNVIIRDANNCDLPLPIITINQPALLSPSPVTVPPSCFGICDGQLTVNVNGGTAPFTYEWKSATGVTIGTGVSVNNLCAATYSVQVRDANGCTTPFLPVTLNQPVSLSSSILVIDPYCNDGDGYMDLTVSGGTTPYSFSWNNGLYSTEDIFGLSGGTYTVVVTDANGCTLTDSETFIDYGVLTVTLVPRLTYAGLHFECNGDSTGGVIAYVTGGVPPYSFQWNDPDSSTIDSLYGLVPGTYAVTVTDSLRCIYVDSITLDLVPPPFSNTEIHSDVTCVGFDDGTITIFPTGGVPPHYVYWQHDTTIMSPQLTGLSPGTYVAYIFDTNTCILADTIEIIEPQPLVTDIAVTNISCGGSGTGELDLTVSGGAPPYTYSWNNGAFNTEDLTGLSVGIYSVVVTDSNGCTIDDSAEIIEPLPIVLSIIPAHASCFGRTDAGAQLTVAGGTPPFSFDWNNGLYTTQNLENVSPGSYSVVVTDAGNCVETDSTTLNEPAILTGARQISACVGDSVLLEGVYQTQPGVYFDTLSFLNSCDTFMATTLSFISEFRTDLSLTICFGQSHSAGGGLQTVSGIYTDSLTAQGGCDSIIVTDLTVRPAIGLYAIPDTATILPGESVAIEVFISSSANILDYSWTPTVGLSCDNCPTTIATPENSTVYTIVALDDFGCVDTTQVRITVEYIEPETSIYVPNAFTPNGDGINDVFMVYGTGFEKFRLLVFDRWGEKLFESTNPMTGWDGTFKGKLLNPDVFVYYIDIEFTDNLVPSNYLQYKKGSVTLIR